MDTNFMDYFDLATIALYMFWAFFAGLIFYLQREAQREGYPVEVDGGAAGRFRPKSLLFYPPPKTFLMSDGTARQLPDGKADLRVVPGQAKSGLPGAAIHPNNANPMGDNIGPGSWAERSDKPDMMFNGSPRIQPTRVAPSYHVEARDINPVGLTVYGCDGASGGKVVDVWVDRAECVLRYLEVENHNKQHILLPINFTLVRKGGVRVHAITGGQFVNVPSTKQPDTVTLLEEDKIAAYYGSGTLYALPGRQEPLL